MKALDKVGFAILLTVALCSTADAGPFGGRLFQRMRQRPQAPAAPKAAAKETGDWPVPSALLAPGDDDIRVVGSIGTRDGKTITATGIASPYKDPLTGKSVPSHSVAAKKPVPQPKAPPLVKDPVVAARLKKEVKVEKPAAVSLDAP